MKNLLLFSHSPYAIDLAQQQPAMITTAGSSLFHSPHQLIVGNSPLVGVLDLPGTIKRPPIRLFFPASTTTTTTRRLTPAKYFVNNRVAYVLQGFAHIVLARHTTKVFRFILRPLLWLVSLIFPARFLIIPDTVHVRNNRKDNDVDLVKYVPPSELSMNNDDRNNSTKKKDKTQSLVMFSHGLTGTGEENSIFCTSLAKRGHVVASIHHRDGSSSRVPLADGTCLYYKHLPTGDEYNPHDRLEQVHYRAQELLYATSWMMGEVEEEEENNGNKNEDNATTQVILNQIRSNLSKDNIIASGFSYGSATVALASTLQSQRYKCAILLDPWLHIDYSSKGYEFDFPPEAFGKPWPESSTNDYKNSNTKNDGTTDVVDDADIDSSLKQRNGGRGLNIPAIFINSSQFAGYTKLYGATCRLADIINSNSNNKSSNENDDEHPRAEMHVIDETTHQNFCDTIFWLPRRIAKKIFGLGDANAYDAYESILNLTNKFLDRF